MNFARNGGRHYISRAKEKTTNLALTGEKRFGLKERDGWRILIFLVLTVFMITNTPYMVDEFIRMDKSWFVSGLFYIFNFYIYI